MEFELLSIPYQISLLKEMLDEQAQDIEELASRVNLRKCPKCKRLAIAAMPTCRHCGSDEI